MTDTDLVEVTITAPDRDWLVDLCRQLVDARLAASAHVIHPVSSIYRWEGEVHEATEARAFLRSRFEVLDELVAYVLERHPYQVPNVTAIPIVGGNSDYLAWIAAETAARGGAETRRKGKPSSSRRAQLRGETS
jgi:periplasmic divalent cation tolerance protein